MAEVKDIIVKITIEGDTKYLNALAKFEAANARRIKGEREVAKAIEQKNKQQEKATTSTYKQTMSEQQAQKEANKTKQAYVQLGQQVQDFGIQVQGGTSWLVAFSQQMPQAAFVAKDLGGSLGKVASFLTGPWGTAIILAVSVLTPLVTTLLKTKDATDDLKESEKALVDSQVAVLESRAKLDEALGRNTDSYEKAEEAARNAGIAEIESAAKAVKATQIRLKAALAEYILLQRQQKAEASGDEKEGTGSSTILRMFGFGDLTDEITAANKATEILNKATSELNETLATQAQRQNTINKDRERAAEKARRAEEKAAREREREAKRLQREEDKRNKPVTDLVADLAKGRPEISKIQDEINLLNKALAQVPKDSAAAQEGYRRLAAAQKELVAAYHKINEEENPILKVIHDLETAQEETAKLNTIYQQLITSINSGQYTGPFLKALIDEANKTQDKIDPEGAPARKKALEYDKSAGLESLEVTKVREQIAEQEKVIEYLRQMGAATREAEKDLEALQMQLEKLQMTAGETWALNTAVEAINALADGFAAAVEGTKTFAQAFEDMAKVVVAEITKLIVKFLLLQVVSAIFGGGSKITKGVAAQLKIPGVSGEANGGVFNNGNRINAYANGGIVTKPTLFPMANGNVGLMGEAGYEAIMPLQRGSDGKLGVQAAPVNVQVINNAGAAVSVRQEDDKTLIILEAVEQSRKAITSDIRRGGNLVSRSLENTYGVNRGR